MKTILMMVLIATCASAEEARSEKSSLEKDFAIICEIHRSAKRLAVHPAFRKEAPDLAFRRASMLEAGLTTPEAKNALKAIVLADPKDRESLWHNAARDAGLKGWRCVGIGRD